MKFNPKLTSTQMVLGIILALAIGYWVWSAPMRSLANSSRWISKHKVDWELFQKQNPSYNLITLTGTTRNRGTVVMYGYAPDEESKNIAGEFVLERKPPGDKFENMVKVLTQEDFKLMLEIRKEIKQDETQ